MPVCSVTLARICGAVGVVCGGDVDIFAFVNSYFELKLQAEPTQKNREKKRRRRRSKIVVKNAFNSIKLLVSCAQCPH